jgi:hypothetical protein
VSRYLVVALVRLLLLVAAGWFAFSETALGEDVPLVSRMAVVLSFLVLSIVLGELDRLRTHFALLLGALRSAGGSAAARVTQVVAATLDGNPGETRPDPREAVDILVKALGAGDAQTRAKVHARLRTLTGQDLPPDAGTWAAWWSKNRAAFGRPKA